MLLVQTLKRPDASEARHQAALLWSKQEQKAKETSETEATKQPTKTSDSRLRRGHGHVVPQETLHLS
ncbi:hypothetical protein PAMP_002652 [Pampus punctatissimus]